MNQSIQPKIGRTALVFQAMCFFLAGCLIVSCADIEVSPETMYAIEGQRAVFLVERTTGFGLCHINASAQDAEVLVENGQFSEGDIAEVTVIPKIGSDSGAYGTSIYSIPVSIECGGNTVLDSQGVTVEVVGGRDTLNETARVIRGHFVEYLENEVPALGITSETAWEGTIVRPNILVVMHYLFFSDDWEMSVMWHVMVPPQDWAVANLRHRYTETQYSYAFKQDSVENATVIYPKEPDMELDR